MSINSAMLAGVSGLVANSSALAAISDNIANVNTVAYKRNQVNFASVVTAQAVPGHYSAGGVQAVTRQLISQQGLIQTANSPTDLAVNGDGFFVVTQNGAPSASDQREFTRSGSFHVDANGYMVNDAGLYLQGWLADSAGNFSVDPSDLTSMKSINIKSLGTAVAATGNIEINATLDKRTTLSPAEATYDPVAKSMADYAVNQNATTGTPPDFTMEMNVVDSTGGSHKIAMAFLKGNNPANPNEWHAEIYAVPASDVTEAAGNPAGQIASGVVSFNSDGSIDLANTTLFGGLGATPKIDIGASNSATGPHWAASLGVADQPISLDVSKISLLSSPNALNSVNSDGASVGNVIAVQVDQDGVVSAIFDNSQIRKIAKIGLATFPNPDGLKSVSGNAYLATIPAGVMVAKAPGVGGAGKISPSSLEASTVDLSAEFTGLITTQKAYSASSKIITTADQMLDELIQMKR
jgi:flagellar hook protein FlgE